MGLLDFLKKSNNSSKGDMPAPSKSKQYPQVETKKLDKKLEEQDDQLSKIQEAERKYEQNKDIVALIAFWENIWATGGITFLGSKWTFRLPDLYIKQKRYDDALRIVKKIKNPAYQDKAAGYIDKIQKLKQKVRN